MRLMLLSLIGLFIVFTTGCMSGTQDNGNVYSAVYIGDKSTMRLREVIAAVPLKDKGYANLHIDIDAVVQTDMIFTSTGAEVNGIIGRLSSRIYLAVLDCAQGKGPLSAADLPALRNEICAKAQETFNKEYSKWTHAKDYKVTFIVTSIFLTDGSVGRASENNRWAW